jgi:hypothetical protein
VTMVPVMFRDASSADKPRKNAPKEAWAAYKEQRKAKRLSMHGVRLITEMRDKVNSGLHLWVGVDGSYTNRTMLNELPEDTVLIGRIRSDAKLYYLPEGQEPKGAGRKRLYGEPTPTPEAMRQDDDIPWHKVKAYASGKEHEFKVKVVRSLRWRGTGKRHTLQLMVIAPLRYRLSRSSKLLYRDPAYLICTDPEAPADRMLQAYLWRWGIETNFRDEKTILGAGEAHVRHSASVKAVPQMKVAAYSLLLMAGIKLWGVKGLPDTLDLPKWRDSNTKIRASTCDLITELRRDLWAHSIASTNFPHFTSRPNPARSLLNIDIPAYSAILNVSPG